MSRLANFRVTNPKPKDPLQMMLATGRGAILSPSSTRARAIAVDVAIALARTTGRTLVAIDCPAVHHALHTQLSKTAAAIRWQLLSPQILGTAPLATQRECVVLANHAVAPPQSRTGLALADLVRRAHSAVVIMRQHDLGQSPAMVEALGRSAIFLTA